MNKNASAVLTISGLFLGTQRQRRDGCDLTIISSPPGVAVEFGGWPAGADERGFITEYLTSDSLISCSWPHILAQKIHFRPKYISWLMIADSNIKTSAVSHALTLTGVVLITEVSTGVPAPPTRRLLRGGVEP